MPCELSPVFHFKNKSVVAHPDGLYIAELFCDVAISKNARGSSYAAFDLSVRWALLDRRLEATAEKIEKIKAGKISIDLSEKRPSAEPQAEGSDNKEQKAAALPVKGPALPVDKATVRKALEDRAEEELPVPADISETDVSEQELSAGSEAELIETPEEKEENFKREILMQDAIGRADPEAFRIAYTAEGPLLESLWNSFLEQDEANGFAALKSMGVVVGSAEPPPKEGPEPAEVYAPDTAQWPVAGG